MNKSHAHPVDEHAAITVSAAKCKGNAAGVPCFNPSRSSHVLCSRCRPARSVQNSCAPTQNSPLSHEALDRFISATFPTLPSPGTAASATVEELETVYTVQMDVPGVSKEQLDISVEADVVRVTSKADAARRIKAAWRFPLEIDTTSSAAKLENGVLSLTLGKKIPVSSVRQLSIQ